MPNRIRLTAMLLLLFWGSSALPVHAAEIAHWTMNESEGNVIADLIGGHNASLHGAAWTMGALKLDGIDDYVDCGNAPVFNLTNALTLEAWINPANAIGKQVIICKSEAGVFQYSLELSEGRLQGALQLPNGKKTVSGDTVVTPGKWHHVHLTYDGKHLRIFLNGLPDGSIDATGNISAGNAPLLLGKGDPSSAYFCGMIDEVKIFNHAMTTAEIAADNYPYNQWSFLYWSLLSEFTHTTGGMVKTSNEVAFWRDRGVRPLHWKGGRSQYSASFNQVSAYLEYWTNKYPQWPGIAIDEFSAKNDAIDQLLGDTLGETRSQYPHLYLAPYCIGISGAKVVDGLKNADKIQLETYLPSSRGNYKTITARHQQAAEHQLTNITLLTLGLNRDWITTPTELRRQLHFIRYNYPNLNGIGIYNSNPDYNKYLQTDLNYLLQGFYTDPVLRMEPRQDGTIIVRNIGGKRSEPTTIRIMMEGKEKLREIPSLDSGASYLANAGQSSIPMTEFTPCCFKLAAPLLYTDEPAALRLNAGEVWPEIGMATDAFICDFSTDPIAQTEQDGALIKAAYCPIKDTAGRNFEMSFDLQVNQTRHYGNIDVGLSSSRDASAIRLNIYRGDGEPSPRMTILVTDATGLITREEIAANLVSASYRMKVRYSTQGHVRAALLDNTGKKLWDTGEFPVYNPIGLDRLRFGIRPSADSLLQWDSIGQRLHLRGAASPAYILDAYVDNFRIDSWN